MVKSPEKIRRSEPNPKRGLLVPLTKEPTQEHKKPEAFREHLFLYQLRQGVSHEWQKHPLKLNNAPLRDRYTKGVDARVSTDIASGLAEPTDEERLVARISLLTDTTADEKVISQALDHALRWGRSMDSLKLQEEQTKLPAAIVRGKEKGTDFWEAVALLSRMYRSFTYAEIAALADPQTNLPRTMSAMDDGLRNAIAEGIETSTKAAALHLKDFPWERNAARHGLQQSRERSLSRGSGMSMS